MSATHQPELPKQSHESSSVIDECEKIARENSIRIESYVNASTSWNGYTSSKYVVINSQLSWMNFVTRFSDNMHNYGVYQKHNRCYIPIEVFSKEEVIKMLTQLSSQKQQQSQSSSVSSSSTSSTSSQPEEKKQKALEEEGPKPSLSESSPISPTLAKSSLTTSESQERKQPKSVQLKWLGAAKDGDISALQIALQGDQDINEVVDGETALQATIIARKLSALEYLLNKGAHCDVLTPQGTALTTTLFHGDEKLLTKIIQTPSGQRALNLVHIQVDEAKRESESFINSEACYFPLTYLTALYDKASKEAKSTYAETTQFFLKACLSRPPFWPVMTEPSETKLKTPQHTTDILSHLYRFYASCYDLEQPQRNCDLLRYAIARLTGQNIQELLTTIPEKSLLGGLNNENMTSVGEESPCWQHEPFLTLRIGTLFALGCALTLDAGQEFKKFTKLSSKRELQDRLDHIIAIELEMLRTAQEIRALPLDAGKPTKLTQAGYGQIAQRLCNKIAALPDGEEYAFAFGWATIGGAHAIYMSWMRRNNEIIWRVDNLERPENDYYHATQYDNVGSQENYFHGRQWFNRPLCIQSALIGKCTQADLTKKEYLEHFTQLVQAFHLFPSHKEGIKLSIKLAYEPPDKLGLKSVGSEDPLRKTLPYLTKQVRSNCYVKSHEPGDWIRFQQDKSLIEYIQECEKLNVKAWQAAPGLSLKQCQELEINLQKRLLVKPPLEKKHASLNPAKSSSSLHYHSSSSSSASSSAMPTAPLPVPSHDDLLKHLQDRLGCSESDVRQGCVVEQSLVGLADIKSSQKGAQFLRERDGNNTCFQLLLNASELEKFQIYFVVNHPEFIKKCGNLRSGKIQIDVDTSVLYHQITEELAKHHRTHFSLMP
ncbi:MAG TPA: hypothetical protein VHE99_04180 [Gammaproteobacteria bacterium]|nr:hypothetical protein [Gammaproteobacteria bacterium]